MKAKIRSARVLSGTVLVMSLIAACAPFGRGGSSTATATLQEVQDDYHQAELQTEATEDALLELYLSPACDLKQAYKTFSEDVLRMQRDGEPLLKHADRMHFDGAAYLVESGQNRTACPLPGRREGGDQTTAELGDYFDAIADDAWEVKRAYREYEFDLDQIRKYLCMNLTPSTVDSLTFMVRKAQSDSANLSEALLRVQDSVDAAKAAKEAVAAAAPATPPTAAPATAPMPVPPRPGP